MTIDAVVVGSGPNGLAAAVVLARAGLSVEVLEAADEPGGGARSAELTIPGLVHDVCSAVHPFGIGSPVFTELGLDQFGLRWLHTEVALAHPFEDGTAAVMYQDLDRTAAGLGADGDKWRAIFQRPSERWWDLAGDLLRPLLAVPRHPTVTVPFGLRGLLPTNVAVRAFDGRDARALLAGAAAHAIRPLTEPGPAAVGLALLAAGHAVGWPVAEGGSQAITSALVAALQAAGGSLRTGTRVTSMGDLPDARTVLFDTVPSVALGIAGDQIPAGRARALRRFRHGWAAYKLDLAVEGGVPWTAEAARRAGTVHLGGPAEQIIASEAAVGRGEIPDRPFALVGQQYLADPARSVGDVHPVWTYMHVPPSYTGDLTEHLEQAIEVYAPGFRERIVARHVWRPADFAAYNPNYVGGDIAGGSADLWQVVARPQLRIDPYRIGARLWLCSASTPPGAGVHGMGGANAAKSVLNALSRGGEVS